MEGTSSEMVRFVFRPKTKCNKRFARQHRYEPPQESLLTSPFSRLRSPSFKSRHLSFCQTTFKITECTPKTYTFTKTYTQNTT